MNVMQLNRSDAESSDDQPAESSESHGQHKLLPVLWNKSIFRYPFIMSSAGVL